MNVTPINLTVKKDPLGGAAAGVRQMLYIVRWVRDDFGLFWGKSALKRRGLNTFGKL